MKKILINRRLFIGSTALVVTAPTLLTACDTRLQLEEVQADGQFFNAEQLTILLDVAEIMIPETQTPGATTAQVVPVLDAMMLTWAGKKAKHQFPAFIQQIEALAKESFSTAYRKLKLAQREQLLTEMDKAAFSDEGNETMKNYRHLKQVIFHLYYSSEEANPHFRLIPGDYRGCVSSEELAEIYERGYL